MYLMLKDKEVLYFDFDEFLVQEINPDLVPFCMRYAFKRDLSIKSLLHNVQILKSYLSRRVLSLSRDNAKNIYTLFGIPQLDDIETKVSICLFCKGVSVQDSYWVKSDNSNEKFADVNIRKNHFKEIVDISLFGDNPSITTNFVCPELTTHGVFRKAWIRDEKGVFYLLKSDRHSKNVNTKMEVLASEIISCFENRVACVEYVGSHINTKNGVLFVDRCKNFVGERYSFVEAWELMEYANRMNMSFREKILGYSSNAASIAVLDFIVSNTDRHMQNYGFLMCNSSGAIEGIAPLFDFNLALVSDVYNKDVSDTLSQMFNDGSTLRELALSYRPYCKIVLNITKFNHIRELNKQFDFVFARVLMRCRYLGIKEVV